MMLKEENRIRALAKLGRHVNKDINYVKTAILQGLTDLSFNKNSIYSIVEEVYGTSQDILDDEIKLALGCFYNDDIDNEQIINALNKLGQQTKPIH